MLHEDPSPSIPSKSLPAQQEQKHSPAVLAALEALKAYGITAEDFSGTHLDLSSKKLGDSGATALSRVLEKNRTLTHLNLSDNEIGKEGGKALESMLVDNRLLTQLELANNLAKDLSEITRYLVRNQTTPFHSAVYKGDCDEVKRLIEQKADINLKDEEGLTPLYVASSNGQSEMAKLLIEQKADLTAKKTDDSTLLHAAALGGVTDIAKLLIEQKAAVNAKGKEEQTPLHMASSNGQSELAKLLIEQKAEVNAQGYQKQTPLYVASSNGQSEMAKLLIEQKADLTAKKTDDSTLLHAAALGGVTDIAKLLIEQKAAVDAKDQWEQTPLHKASSTGQSEVTKLLIEQKAEVNAKDYWQNTPLYGASEKGQSEVAKLLIEQKADLTAKKTDDSTLLHAAALGGVTDIAKLLIEQKAAVDAKDQWEQTPLHKALSNGQSEMAKLLIEQKAAVNAKDKEEQTPLHKASSTGQSELAKLLIEQKAEVNAKGGIDYADNPLKQTPLHMALKEGQSELAKLLIEQKAEVNAKDKEEQTPLHKALSNGQSEVTKLLIEQKAEVNAKDQWEQTPLHMALKEGQSELAKLLIEQKAEVNAQGYQKQTPLHKASSNGQSEVAKLLIEQKAEVNAQGYQKQTPLHMASSNGQSELAKLLIEQKAEVNTKDQWEQTPLHIATRQGHTEIIEFLLDQKVALEALDSDGSTPLMVAAGQGKLSSILEALVQAKANVNFKNEKGQSALMAAVEGNEKIGYLDTVKTLLKWKATLSLDDLKALPDNKSKQYLMAVEQGQQAAETIGMLNKQGYLTVSFQVKYADLSFGRELGEGSFGKVYLGTYQFNPVAIKTFDAEKFKDKEVNEFRQEASVMASISMFSDYLVKLRGICLEKPTYCMVMELMPQGDLYKLLKNKKIELPWSLRYRLARDISVGLYHLHKQAIWHRDLKSLNIFLDALFRAKLGDFGLATLKPLASKEEESFQGGTVLWSAPEIIKNQPYTAEADIFSLGIVFYELATRQLPYAEEPDLKAIRARIIKAKKLALPSECPSAFTQLIHDCCEEKPAQRPTVFEIVQRLEVLCQQEEKQTLLHTLPGESAPTSLSTLELGSLTTFSPLPPSNLTTPSLFGDITTYIPHTGVSTFSTFRALVPRENRLTTLSPLPLAPLPSSQLLPDNKTLQPTSKLSSSLMMSSAFLGSSRFVTTLNPPESALSASLAMPSQTISQIGSSSTLRSAKDSVSPNTHTAEIKETPLAASPVTPFWDRKQEDKSWLQPETLLQRGQSVMCLAQPKEAGGAYQLYVEVLSKEGKRNVYAYTLIEKEKDFQYTQQLMETALEISALRTTHIFNVHTLLQGQDKAVQYYLAGHQGEPVHAEFYSKESGVVDWLGWYQHVLLETSSPAPSSALTLAGGSSSH